MRAWLAEEEDIHLELDRVTSHDISILTSLYTTDKGVQLPAVVRAW
jgi:hypothetical protein